MLTDAGEAADYVPKEVCGADRCAGLFFRAILEVDLQTATGLKG